jgi:hypothetical protein
MLDAVIDVKLHQRLVNDTSNKSKISHEYVRYIFDRCNAFIDKNMKGLNWISFSVPTDSSSLLFKDAVPVTDIMHGPHETSLDTVRAMFGSIDGFTAAWTPMYFGPCLPCKACTVHAMYKAFLDTSSPIPTDPFTNIRVHFKGISAPEQVILKLKERGSGGGGPCFFRGGAGAGAGGSVSVSGGGGGGGGG